jgi:hypothetical protein
LQKERGDKVAEVRSKIDAILQYLKAGNAITDSVAVQMFDAHRLGDVIFRLRKRGYAIETKKINKKDRYGRTVQFAEYRLLKEEPNT